ncbi:MAG: hypothetical protein A3J97_01090 [Spirochaetes bacterium RIFOXYC1_FULL_54_7]|nr:MAG: hypothetical protein A3J97_01090 [Spirochaetes bacterium RIFOXYC1_FULL_54_7]
MTSDEIRKAMFFFTFLLLLALDGFGDDLIPRLTFTSETGLAFIYGEAEEIVYKSPSGTDLLSLLVYPVPPGLGAYVGMEARWRDSILTRIRLETAWPLMSGNLTDDDWGYDTPSTGEPDVHSDSTAYLTSWVHGDLEFGFPDNRLPITVETLFGFTFRQMAWEGWDALQNPGTTDYPTGEISGYIIDYRQTWLIPWIGFSLGHKESATILAVSLRFAPWMSVVGRDVHMARTEPTTFVDVMSGGVMVSGGLRGEIRLADNIWLAGRISLEKFKGARGDTFIYEVGSPIETQYPNTGGAALILFSSYLGFSIHP